MNKTIISLALLCLLQGTSIAFAEVQNSAFSDKNLKDVPLKLLPKAIVEEAPVTIESSDESELVLSEATATPELIAKEYAGAKVWGKVCNIVHTPEGNLKWSINRYDLKTDTVETVFGVTDNRKIQSVACDPSGFGLIFSMKDSLRGDYEIYSLSPGVDNPLFQITNNTTDDVDVTSDRESSTIAWQQRLADGRQAILLNRFNYDTGEPLVRSLASASPFVQPSLSANGKWLVFVQLRPSFFAVMRYDIENNKYKEIRKIARRKRLYHPTISDDGNIIAWSENRKQNRYMVKNISENTLTQVLNNSNGIEHASVASTGDVITYSINTDNKRQTFLTHIETLETSRLGAILYNPNRYLGTSWLGSSLQDLSTEMISGQVFISPDGPFALIFSSDATGAEFSDGDGEFSDLPDPYIAGFTWQVDDGKLSVDYPEGSESDSVDVSLVSIDENKYTVVGEDENGDGGVAELLKAKPLSIADLNGKTISLDMSQDSDCSAMTFSFAETTANNVEVCADIDNGIRRNNYTLNESNNFDNILVLVSTGTTDNVQLSVVLIDGSVDAGGKLAFIVRKNDILKDVVIHNFTVVEEEASLHEGTLAALIVGKTLYQHVSENGESSISTLEFKTNGEVLVNDVGHVETIPYRIVGDTVYTTDTETQTEQAHPMIESTDSYVKLSDTDGTSTFYYTREAALAGPVEVLDGNGGSSSVESFSVEYLSKNPWYVIADNGDCFAKFVYSSDGSNAIAFFIGDDGQNTSESFIYAVNATGDLTYRTLEGELLDTYSFSEAVDDKFKATDTYVPGGNTANVTGFSSHLEAISYANEKGNPNCAKYLPE